MIGRRRAPLVDVADLDEVVTFVQLAPAPVTMILDVDNTLVPQGAAPDEFIPAVEAAIDRLEATDGVGRVLILSNGAERGVPRMVSRGNKPWTSRRRMGLDRTEPAIVVVGDQVLTDGVLAWRLGAVYARLVVDPTAEPPGQVWMRRLGALVAPLILRQTGSHAWP